MALAPCRRKKLKRSPLPSDFTETKQNFCPLISSSLTPQLTSPRPQFSIHNVDTITLETSLVDIEHASRDDIPVRGAVS